MKVLYTSAELHDAIKHVLGSPTKGERRVVLVAYLGSKAESFLPHPQGLEIVCSMEPGSTSADAIIRLRDRGAKIRQSDRLHMKVYWSSKKGAVICSANASANALARRGLKEAGVLLPAGAVKVDKLLDYAKPRSISSKDLHALAREADRLSPMRSKKLIKQEQESPSLKEWLASPGRKPWKLGWWDGDDGEFSKAASAEARERHGARSPHAMLSCSKGDCRSGDWLLQFNSATGKQADWLYVDFAVKVSKSDKRAFDSGYPWQAIQVFQNARYAAPPFRLDSDSRRALARAVTEMGTEAFESLASAKAPVRFIRLLKQHSA